MTRIVWSVIAVVVLAAAAAGAAPGAADVVPVPADSIWTSERAAADSVARYWEGVDREWYEPLRPEDIGMPVTPGRYDSLVTAADRLLADMRRHRPWRLVMDWWPAPGFNRVDGWRLSVGARLEQAGIDQPDASARVGWAFSRERLLWDARLRWPLWKVRPLDARGRLTRAPWTALALEARARRAAAPFGVEPGAASAWGALLYGSDPAHYFEQEEWRVGLVAVPRPWLAVRAGGGHGRHRPLARHTDWTLLGDAADVEGNLPIAGLERRTWDLGLTVRSWRLSLGADLAWHRVTDSPLTPVAAEGHAWYRRLTITGSAWRDDPWGGRLLLRGGWESVDRTAPVEWAVWLGGFERLRGFPSRELGGDRGGWVSLDWAVNADPLARVPLLGRLHLQPVLLADYGHTDRHDPAAVPAVFPSLDDTTPAGATGWRADVGVALQARLGLGDLARSVRLTAARPVGQGMGDRDWRLTLMIGGW